MHRLSRLLLLVTMFLYSNHGWAQTVRTPLIEQFTATSSGWCPVATDSINAILSRTPNARAVAHHITIHEPMRTSDNDWLAGHLIMGSPPAVTIDRVPVNLPTGGISFPVNQSDWGSIVSTRAMSSAPLSISVAGTWNPFTRQLAFNVTLNILQNMQGEFYLNAYLSEDSLMYPQMLWLNGTNVQVSPYYHNRVTRKMIAGQYGTMLTSTGFANGQVVFQQYSYNVPTSYNISNCHLTVFVTSKLMLVGLSGPSAFNAAVQQAWQESILNVVPVVPVELVSLHGAQVNDGVRLEWRTATESNNRGWFIERRKNEGSWNDLGFVDGRGTTHEQQQYEYFDSGVRSGNTYDYRLRQVDFDGTIERSEIMRVMVAPTPTATRMLPNYPNPFNPSTTIVVELAEQSDVNVTIYDMLGRHIRTLVSGVREAGGHMFEWDGTDANGNPVESGMYFARMITPTHTATQQMQLSK